jgi:capsular exopolysaccharide synthesis family protein
MNQPPELSSPPSGARTPVSPIPAQPAPQGFAPGQDDDFIDLTRLINAVLQHKWAILALAFAISLITGLWVKAQEPTYRASASVVLEATEANLLTPDPYNYSNSYQYDYFQTQFEILKSRSLAERVARKLQLHKHPIFQPAQGEDGEAEAPFFNFNLRSLLPAREQEPPVQLTPEQQEERQIQNAASYIAGGLSVQPVEYSHVAYLNFDATDPVLAATIVNTLAQEFIAGDLETRTSGTIQATEWMTTRLNELKTDLRESEQALQDFREQEGLVDVDGETSLGGSELYVLSQRLEETRRARIEAQTIMENVQGMRDASIEELMTIPAVLQHDVVRDIKREQASAERTVAELGKRYGVKHPKMIAAQSDLAAANDSLEREVRKVVSGISREYELALRNEQQLQTNWEARKSEMQNFNRVEFQLRELQRDVDTNRELYDAFFSRIRSLTETGGFESPHARLVDRALPPQSPYKPNVKMSVVLAFVLGTMLGCGVAILLDMLDNTIKKPEDVGEKLHAPLLGAIPREKPAGHGYIEHIWEKPRGIFAEAVRSIRTSLLLNQLDNPARVIVITSTVPGEGKSTLALNLGVALGQMEKVLVLGGDLRQPGLASKCGLDPKRPGLSHFVSEAAVLEECIVHMEDMGVDVMTSGLIPPNPLEMLSSRKFAYALEELRQRYDRIVIDSAPMYPVSDALVLAALSDIVIYVVKADSTSATQVQKGIDAILANHEPLAGVVLNQFDAKKLGKAMSQYSHYYTAEEPT